MAQPQLQIGFDLSDLIAGIALVISVTALYLQFREGRRTVKVAVRNTFNPNYGGALIVRVLNKERRPIVVVSAGLVFEKDKTRSLYWTKSSATGDRELEDGRHADAYITQEQLHWLVAVKGPISWIYAETNERKQYKIRPPSSLRDGIYAKRRWWKRPRLESWEKICQVTPLSEYGRRISEVIQPYEWDAESKTLRGPEPTSLEMADRMLRKINSIRHDELNRIKREIDEDFGTIKKIYDARVTDEPREELAELIREEGYRLALLYREWATDIDKKIPKELGKEQVRLGQLIREQEEAIQAAAEQQESQDELSPPAG